MARVFVRAWRSSYVGVVPHSVLQGLDEAKTTKWLGELAEADEVCTTVAVGGSGSVIGFARYGRDLEQPNGNHGYLASLYVDPGASGQGVGRALVDHALKSMEESGCSEVSVWVFQRNFRARRLYERFGFRPEGAERLDPRWSAPQIRYRRRRVSVPGGRDPYPMNHAVDKGANTWALEVRSPTEERNPHTEEIDLLPTTAVLELINDQDSTVPAIVRKAIPELSLLVDVTTERLSRGGRVHYFGAGSSGRLGVLDAAELAPTFGVGTGLFVAHLAGGDKAIRNAAEGAEDEADEGDAEAAGVRFDDVAIGIAASGYTRYVEGALRRARSLGATTALVTSNPHAPLSRWADISVLIDTGPEVITGSTRMKSATAQKLVLNAFSTAVMIRSGRTWSNLMVDLVPVNAKLRGRVLRMLRESTGASAAACERALEDAGDETKTAIVMLCSGVGPVLARAALEDAKGHIATALGLLGVQGRPGSAQ